MHIILEAKIAMEHQIVIPKSVPISSINGGEKLLHAFLKCIQHKHFYFVFCWLGTVCVINKYWDLKITLTKFMCFLLPKTCQFQLKIELYEGEMLEKALFRLIVLSLTLFIIHLY